MHKKEEMGDSYKIVSGIYNELSHLYSFGAIPQCREAWLSGDIEDVTICFIGVGHGDEAIHAAKLGAQVTVVDLSASMLEKFESNTQGPKPERREKFSHCHHRILNWVFQRCAEYN